MKRAINLLFPLFLLNSCLALRIRHEYHEKLESAAQLDHTACKYYAKGNLYPNSQKLFVTAAITDITIGVSLGILNPWIGGGYFLLGLGVLGERLSPFTSMIWCGSPSNPTEPPYDFFYVFDSAHFYSCFNGSCKDHYGCALIPQRKQAILWYFVIVNGIDF
ncbi:MAG: hypothetical protein IT569_10365 [Leptospiraceae bacterium]|nr:hypothetical protein [Leptospiraceae bacterium]